MAVGRSGASCSTALQGRQTQCGGDGLHSRSPGGQTQCAGVSRLQGGNDESPIGARRYGGSMPRTTARPGHAGRRNDNSGRIAELPNAKHLASGIYRPVPHANDGEHLQPSSGRVATAAVRPDGTDGRAAAWPPAVVPCTFGGEGALLPLADSAGQALSRFMPSASIHKARLILTFWSMP